jgi:hypothetical protein
MILGIIAFAAYVLFMTQTSRPSPRDPVPQKPVILYRKWTRPDGKKMIGR